MCARTKQSSSFHAEPVDSDSARQTVACRHATPNFCAKHTMSTICALARPDDMCLAPPLTSSKQVNKLRRLKSSHAELT
jgi:hypothetical protein